MFEFNTNNKTKYEVLKRSFINEQSIELVEITHIKTKAKIVLLICEDENRVFNIVFKTPVTNSTGVPHILEHSVLCGSKKYNVKDPFVELAKGSMNTFLNAMTFPDKTCYPVASANIKDFHNLMDVYLDAVFYPNAIENDNIFRQEGWHYEVENKDSELEVNGVVFNEMKGVYSDPDSILESSILNNIFKDTNYAYEYGGMPSEIINLTFDEFKRFHEKYYSPSNAIVYLYGKLDYNYELEYLDKEYLQNFEYIDVAANFLSASKDSYQCEQVDYYNIDTDNVKDKSYLAYTFAIGEEKSNIKNIVLLIIDYVLFSSESAILKEKLLNEGYGESVFSRYDNSLKEGFYSIISQNIDDAKKEQFVKVINETLEGIIENGLDVDKFKAGINSIYFNYAEGEYSRMPRGLVLSLLSLDSYLYGTDADIFLRYKDEFDNIKKEDLSNKNNIFIRTIKELFINNEHKCINILKPKFGYSNEKDAILKNELKIRKDSLTKEQLDKVISDVAKLKDYQKTQDSADALKCIPLIEIGDIERDVNAIDYQVEVKENIDTIICYKNDKDIIYLDLKFDISDFSDEEFFLFSLITLIITRVDLISETFHDFNNYVDINTGGLSISIDVTNTKAFLSYKIKVSNDKLKCAFNIFNKLFSDIQFVDSKRINILLNENRQNSLLSILSSGHISAINRSKSTFDFKSRIFDIIDRNGIASFKFITSMCENYLVNCDLINDTLDLLYKKLHKRKMYFTLCTNKKYYQDIDNCFKEFVDNIIKTKMKHIFTEKDYNRLSNNINSIDKFVNFNTFRKTAKNEAILTPNDINFCALSGRFSPDLYSGRLSLIRTLFNYEYLWTNIRVLGGAYGCMSTFSDLGNYSLCSYRDPNVSNTNKVYYGIPSFISGFNKNEEEIYKYVIGTMRSYDNPLSIVDNYKSNISAFFNNITNEQYNKWRHDVLDITCKDLRDMSKIFNDIESADKCALISANKMNEAKEEYDVIWQLMEQ